MNFQGLPGQKQVPGPSGRGRERDNRFPQTERAGVVGHDHREVPQAEGEVPGGAMQDVQLQPGQVRHDRFPRGQVDALVRLEAFRRDARTHECARAPGLLLPSRVKVCTQLLLQVCILFLSCFKLNFSMFLFQLKLVFN